MRIRKPENRRLLVIDPSGKISIDRGVDTDDASKYHKLKHPVNQSVDVKSFAVRTTDHNDDIGDD